MPSWLKKTSAAAAALAFLYGLTLVPWGRGSKAPAGLPRNPVKISIEGGAPVTLESKDGVWRVTAPVEGAVDDEAVRGLLSGLKSLAFESVVTERADSHAQYELEEGKAVRLRIWDAGASSPFDLFLGKNAGFTGRAYARAGAAPAVHLAAGLSREAVDLPLARWRDRRVFSRADIVRVEVTRGKSTYALAKSSDGWTVDGAAADEEKSAAFISALRILSADDLAGPPAGDLKLFGLDKPASAFTVHFSSGAPVSLVCGTGDPRPIRKDGTDVVYWVPAYRFTPLDLSREDLLPAAR